MVKTLTSELVELVGEERATALIPFLKEKINTIKNIESSYIRIMPDDNLYLFIRHLNDEGKVMSKSIKLVERCHCEDSFNR